MGVCQKSKGEKKSQGSNGLRGGRAFVLFSKDLEDQYLSTYLFAGLGPSHPPFSSSSQLYALPRYFLFASCRSVPPFLHTSPPTSTLSSCFFLFRGDSPPGLGEIVCGLRAVRSACYLSTRYHLAGSVCGRCLFHPHPINNTHTPSLKEPEMSIYSAASPETEENAREAQHVCM